MVHTCAELCTLMCSRSMILVGSSVKSQVEHHQRCAPQHHLLSCTHWHLYGFLSPPVPQLYYTPDWPDTLSVTFGLHSYHADTSDCLFPFSLLPHHRSPCTILSERHPLVRYDLGVFLRTIRSCVSFMYDINLRATATTILSIRGVQIPIYLVTSATDSLGKRSTI